MAFHTTEIENTSISSLGKTLQEAQRQSYTVYPLVPGESTTLLAFLTVALHLPHLFSIAKPMNFSEFRIYYLYVFEIRSLIRTVYTLVFFFNLKQMDSGCRGLLYVASLTKFLPSSILSKDRYSLIELLRYFLQYLVLWPAALFLKFVFVSIYPIPFDTCHLWLQEKNDNQLHCFLHLCIMLMVLWRCLYTFFFPNYWWSWSIKR